MQAMSKLPDIKTNFAEWYQEVLVQADIIDQSPTRGCFVIKPYGYALWENIQRELDKKIKALGAKNAYFPLLIPESFLKKEEKHIEGFSPELAIVTIGGGKQLDEPLVVRPTSETMIYYMFSRWIKSWRDLPMAVNQWCNVVRWEMRTRPFVRSLEFLWQEGHTAHRTHEEAVAMVLAEQEMYRQIYEDYLAIPVVTGLKTESERFAGADRTYTVEGLMQDGKALQMCTAHILAQSFPASFDVKFQETDGSLAVPYCTSFGFTTRSVGAAIMSHGDEDGIIMPPRMAPIQAVIVPIAKTDEERVAVLAKAKELLKTLTDAGFAVQLDDNPETTPGAKFFHWEIRGVPVRIELGPKDLTNNQVVFVNRIEKDKARKKSFIPLDNVSKDLQEKLDQIHHQLYERARVRMQSQWHQAEKLEDFGPRMDAENGMYQVGWCGSAACEARVKEYKGTVRCVLTDQKHTVCFACTQPSRSDILVAKAY
jgi:prolyl-tRNA synthetase